jgi:hypothetical protein
MGGLDTCRIPPKNSKLGRTAYYMTRCTKPWTRQLCPSMNGISGALQASEQFANARGISCWPSKAADLRTRNTGSNYPKPRLCNQPTVHQRDTASRLNSSHCQGPRRSWPNGWTASLSCTPSHNWLLGARLRCPVLSLLFSRLGNSGDRDCLGNC